MKKKTSSPPNNLKGKKARHLECMLGWAFPFGCLKFLFPNEFVTIFGPGLIGLTLAKNTLPIVIT
jgi:hypothetical protein